MTKINKITIVGDPKGSLFELDSIDTIAVVEYDTKHDNHQAVEVIDWGDTVQRKSVLDNVDEDTTFIDERV